jgi:hypothetical protein
MSDWKPDPKILKIHLSILQENGGEMDERSHFVEFVKRAKLGPLNESEIHAKSTTKIMRLTDYGERALALLESLE